MDANAIGLIRELTPGIERSLNRHLPRAGVAPALNEAVEYSVFSGGKRMRPVLALVAARVAGLDERQAQRIACSLEYLHTASLILDDLPCMDDTAERRGRMATHVRFGEGVAVLAAMALLNQTYALLGNLPRGRELVALACQCIGHEGMVAGQVIDLVVDADDRAEQRHDHYLKTTALFRLAMLAPAIAAGEDTRVQDALAEYGHCAGMAYQLIDDAHDLEADAMRDGAWDGVTPVELRERAAEWIGQAKDQLRQSIGETRERRFLESFADWLLAGAQASAAH